MRRSNRSDSAGRRAGAVWRRSVGRRGSADRWRDETGSASLEFITTGLVLLVPLFYLILTMAGLQAGAFAVEGAARQAARAYVRSPSAAEARANATLAVEFALADYGIDLSQARIEVVCSPHPDECLTRRGFVTVTVAVGIGMPLLPPVLSVDAPLSVPLRSSAEQQVSRFWSAG